MSVMELTTEMELPADVYIYTLINCADNRGDLFEIYRQSWLPFQEASPIQWNVVRSRAGVLRGVHLHRKHADYLIILEVQMRIGLRDIRKRSPTEGMSTLVELNAAQPQAILIPPGIFHGFYFPVDSLHIYGVSTYWNLTDEYGCSWNDPDLEIPWVIENPILSDRDINAHTYKDLLKSIPPFEYKTYAV